MNRKKGSTCVILSLRPRVVSLSREKRRNPKMLQALLKEWHGAERLG